MNSSYKGMVEIAPNGVLLDRPTNAGPQIAGHTDFNGNLPLGEFLNQIGIVLRGQTVADALGSEVQGAPDGFRPGGFAGVHGSVQSMPT